VLTERCERDDFDGALVRRGENHVRRCPVVMGTEPVGGCNAPPIAGHEAREAVLRHRRAEIVADSLLMREKLLGYDGTNGVTTEVLSSRRTTAVAVETRDGVGATRLQHPTDDVPVSHETSIADGPDPIDINDPPGTPILALRRQSARK